MIRKIFIIIVLILLNAKLSIAHEDRGFQYGGESGYPADGKTYTAEIIAWSYDEEGMPKEDTFNFTVTGGKVSIVPNPLKITGTGRATVIISTIKNTPQTVTISEGGSSYKVYLKAAKIYAQAGLDLCQGDAMTINGEILPKGSGISEWQIDHTDILNIRKVSDDEARITFTETTAEAPITARSALITLSDAKMPEVKTTYMLRLIPFSRKGSPVELLKNNGNILWKSTKGSFFKKTEKGVENSKYYIGFLYHSNSDQCEGRYKYSANYFCKGYLHSNVSVNILMLWHFAKSITEARCYFDDNLIGYERVEAETKIITYGFLFWTISINVGETNEKYFECNKIFKNDSFTKHLPKETIKITKQIRAPISYEHTVFRSGRAFSFGQVGDGQGEKVYPIILTFKPKIPDN